MRGPDLHGFVSGNVPEVSGIVRGDGREVCLGRKFIGGCGVGIAVLRLRFFCGSDGFVLEIVEI